MSATIDYFFTSISPWAYLGHDAARALAAKHGATLVPRPVNLPELFNVSGQVPLAQRAGVRQRYRMIELQRFAHYRGKPMNFRPAHFPVDPALADHTVCAIIASGSDPLDYMEAVFSAVWVNELNIADEDTLAGLLSAAGFGAAGILAKAKGAEAAAIRSKNTEDAIAVDASGVPCFVLNGEPFWGQDRLDLLDHALATGRPPFKPL